MGFLMEIDFWLSYAGVAIFILLVLFAIDLFVIMMILNWIGINKYRYYKKKKFKMGVRGQSPRIKKGVEI